VARRSQGQANNPIHLRLGGLHVLPSTPLVGVAKSISYFKANFFISFRICFSNAENKCKKKLGENVENKESAINDYLKNTHITHTHAHTHTYIWYSVLC